MTHAAKMARAPLPAFTWDPVRLRLVSANPSALSFWGEDSLTDLTERNFAPGDETVRALSARIAEIDEGSDGTGQLIFTPAGDPILTSATCALHKAADGRTLLHIALTEINLSDDTVLTRMRAGFDAAPQAMAVIDANGTVLARNEADRRSFVEGPFAIRFDDPTTGSSALAAALSEGAFSRKALLRAQTGLASFRISLRRMRDPVTGQVAAIAEFSDLTDRPAPAQSQVSDENLITAQELAALIHDLRAPLTAIQGFAEFMAMSGDAMSVDQRAGYLADIGTASQRLQQVIDRIITRAAPEPATPSLAGMIDAAVRLYLPQAQAAGVELKAAEIGDDLVIAIDPVALTRILDNLIGNALTHGAKPGGIVTVSACRADAAIVIDVTDDGPGMDEAKRATALTPFGSQQPAGRSGGLGLSNCAALAKDIGAHLDIITAPGQGLSARLTFSTI